MFKALLYPYSIHTYVSSIFRGHVVPYSLTLYYITAPAAMPGHLGAVSLKKSHDIVILSFCNIVKGQANYLILVGNGPNHLLQKTSCRTFIALRLVIYTIEFASEFCVEFVCRILLSKVTNKVSESRRNLEIESQFRRKFDSR